ncbi:zona pellucida-binding protein 1 isoform X3 [Pezoporus occidentalis]|uniref:zona pellucida-binding protein 1 isoform X3 n=1 Tax=Pezoporus occidentalis TaxID=407982 RepID=UPI002F908034
MRCAERGRARSCRRQTAATAGRLPARRFLLLLLLLGLLPAVQPSKRFLRSAGPKHDNLKIVGSVLFPVKVYVKLNHNSPRILCLTNHLRNLELIDPVFQWTGPGGGLSSENSSVNISPSGTLILRHFNQSGVYTCSIVYKLTAMQLVEHLIIKYLIYVTSLDRENHRLCQQRDCDAFYRLNKAKHLIERFFKQQVEIIRKSSEPLPKIYYIDGTLQMVWVDRCSAGYGMNAEMHPECPGCCVVCSPGSYSPSNGNHCLQCDRSLIYGATKC